MADLRQEEKIVVVGAGIAGLGVALALERQGRRVLLIDRDEPPISDDPNETFLTWNRRGVLHLRQSHVFIGLLYRLIRDEHPKLLDMLIEAGCRELRFEDGLPIEIKDRYRYRRGDEEMTFLSSRRTTLELTMRRYAESFENIEIRTGTRATGVRIGVLDGTPHVEELIVTDQTVDGETREESIGCDIVIDACGRGTPFPAWLQDEHVDVQNDEEDAEILYFTRHYRLNEGCEEPPRGKAPPNGDLTFLKFGIFPGDNGCFSVTLALPARERTLRKGVMKPDGFDRICALLPGMAAWTEPERSTPTSKVWGMGALHSQWRRYRNEEGPSVTGFFALGDALIRTNPLYGRGCSSGVVQGHLLAGVLGETQDPRERADRLDQELERSIREFFEDMRKQDRQAIRKTTRYYEALSGTSEEPTSLKKRLARGFIEDGLIPASRKSIPVLRALLRSLHMLEPPRVVLRDPRLLARIFLVWMTPRALKAKWYPPSPGPARDVFLDELGLQ